MTSLPQINIEIDTVFDFEIYKDTVYFCGVKNSNTGGYGILGYFPISAFTTSSVYYLKMPHFRRAKRVEVGSFLGNTNMIAIGDGIDGHATIVDAKRQSASWIMDFSEAADEKDVFSDLAIIDSFVVVTSYLKNDFVTPARVWFFQKPTTPGSSMFYSFVDWKECFQNASQNILVEACRGNEFVVAATLGKTELGSNAIRIAQFNSKTLNSVVRINEQTSFVWLKDLKFGMDPDVELLINTKDENYPHSIIYHIKPYMFSGTHIVDAHSYYPGYITSIDPWFFSLGQFYASGLDLNSLSYIWHYTYNFNTWGMCLSYWDNTIEEIEKPDKKGKSYFDFIRIDQNPDSITPSIKWVDVVLLCNSTKDDSTENE